MNNPRKKLIFTAGYVALALFLMRKSKMEKAIEKRKAA